MDKSDIVTILQRIGIAMDLEESNPFEIMAFKNGAEHLDDWDGDLEQAAADGTLTDIYGIGKGNRSARQSRRRLGARRPILSRISQTVMEARPRPSPAIESKKAATPGSGRARIISETTSESISHERGAVVPDPRWRTTAACSRTVRYKPCTEMATTRRKSQTIRCPQLFVFSHHGPDLWKRDPEGRPRVRAPAKARRHARLRFTGVRVAQKGGRGAGRVRQGARDNHPARPFLGVSEADNRFIIDTLVRHLDPKT